MLFLIAQLICSIAEAPYALPVGLTTDVSAENQTWMQEQIVRVCPSPGKDYLRSIFRLLLNNTCLAVPKDRKNQVIDIFRMHPLSLFLAEMNVTQLDSVLAGMPVEMRDTVIGKVCAAMNSVHPMAWEEYGRLLIVNNAPLVIPERLLKELHCNIVDCLNTINPSFRMQKMSDQLMADSLRMLSEAFTGRIEEMKARVDSAIATVQTRWIQEQSANVQAAIMASASTAA